MRHLLLSMLLLALPASSFAEDWTQWRGPNRDGKSTETGLFANWDEDGPPEVYDATGIGRGYAAVSVVGDRVYTTGNVDGGQAVTALDAENGKIIWQTPITPNIPQHDYEGSRSTPTVDGDRIYVVASSGAIVCLRAKDGRVVWRREFSDWGGKMMSGWGYSESPLIDRNNVICTPGGPQGMVVALNKNTGKNVWACQLPPKNEKSRDLTDGAGYSSAVISEAAGIRQVVQLVGRGLIGIRADNGELLWQYERVANTTANIPTPIAEGDYIFTSTAYGTGSALLKVEKQGRRGVIVKEVYWLTADDLQNKHGGMILVDGHIYCGTGNGQGLPVCAELSSGKVVWGPERAKGRGEASIVYADGHLVIRREDGTVLLVKATPEQFELVNSFMPSYQEGSSWAHPVIANGRLYLREQDHLMVYQLGNEG